MVKKLFLISIYILISFQAPAQQYTGFYTEDWWNAKEGDSEAEYAKPVVPDEEVLLSMPAQKFQALFTDTLNYALTERNLDTYTDYARMQKAAWKRTEEFINLQILYAQLNPPENENDFNRSLHDLEIERAIHTFLGNVKSEYGLLFFYSDECSYCAKQAPLVEMFKKRHGWEVEYINVNKAPHLAAGFEVSVTPSLRLVNRNSSAVTPVSNGYISLPEIEVRAYRHIRYQLGYTNELNFGEELLR